MYRRAARTHLRRVVVVGGGGRDRRRRGAQRGCDELYVCARKEGEGKGGWGGPPLLRAQHAHDEQEREGRLSPSSSSTCPRAGP